MAFSRRSYSRRPRYVRPRPFVRRARARSSWPKRFPSKDFGRVYFKRGQPFTLEQFGETSMSANPQQLKNRQDAGWKGRGKYSPGKNFRKWATGAVKNVGRGVGSAANSMLLGQMSAAGQGLYVGGAGLYTGEGVYGSDGDSDVNMNQLMEGGRTAPSALAANDETDTIVFSDTEFVRDIYAPALPNAFDTSQTVKLNPGLPSCMPNLSQIALNYVEYELMQCVFELRPVISESTVNNGQSGTAMMVFNYNPNDDPFDSKEDIMQAHGSVSGRITERIVCGVECDPEKTNKNKAFVRVNPVPLGKDIDEYDHGVLTIATNNIPTTYANAQVFELWVSYTVKLRKRRSGALRLLNQQRDLYACFGNAPVNATASLTYQAYLTSIFTSGGSLGLSYGQQNNIGTSLNVTGVYNALAVGGAPVTTTTLTSVLTFPADLNGVFAVTLTGEGTGMTVTQGTYSSTGNVSLVADIPVGNPDSAVDTPFSTIYISDNFRWWYTVHIKVRSATSGVDNSITLPVWIAGGTGITGYALDCVEYSSAMWPTKNQYKTQFINKADSTLVVY